MADNENVEKITKSDQEWRAQLTPEQYAVLRQHGTERPFTGEYVHTKADGTYHCAACGQPLFASDTKFESGSGWPSFWDVVDQGNVDLRTDTSHGMRRTEVLCSRCGSHLGHLFEDGPRDQTGMRYCINSVALKLKPEE
ncbi:MAG: peptide-methionine (R)-S-oxide reductase [Chloroflexi bacterium]|nr:MAG: peptide-methionine (R)-S-oxide reductase [Chloroflexota bacterium]